MTKFHKLSFDVYFKVLGYYQNQQNAHYAQNSDAPMTSLAERNVTTRER